MKQIRDSPRAFVIMPFAAEFQQIYSLFIVGALQEAGYEVTRADDIVSQQNILQDVVQSTVESDLIVADLTGANPNVYYELGIAHAFGKPVILLTQSIADLPFDLRSYRAVSYSTHFADIQKAREEIIRLARGAADGSVAFGSPVKDYAALAPADAMRSTLLAPNVTEEDSSEFGLFDHMVVMEEGFERLSTIMNQVTENTERMGADVNRATEEFLDANANGGSGTARRVQKIARRLGERQSEFAATVAAANDGYEEVLASIENSLENIVQVQNPETQDEREQLKEFLDTLAGVEDSAHAGQQSYLALARTIEESPRIERTMSRANQRASVELRRLAEYVEQTVAIVSRARAIGERILRHSEPAEE